MAEKHSIKYQNSANMMERRFYWIVFISVLFVGFVSFIGIDRLHFAGDPAKYALNIAYPHPPLLRGAMCLSQLVFGISWVQARLPVILLQMGCGVLAFVLLRKGKYERLSALIMSVSVALAPGVLLIARHAYLSTAFLFAALLFWIGIFDLENGKIERGRNIILAASTFACASILQAVLFIPAAFIVVCAYIKKYRSFALVAAPFVLLTFYVLTNPLTLYDILDFSARASNNLFFGHDPYLLIYTFGGMGMVLWSWFQEKKSLSYIVGLAFTVTVALFLWKNNPIYYIPLSFASFVLGIAMIGTRLKPNIQVATSIVFLAITLLSFSAPSIKEYDAWERLIPELRQVVAGEKEVMALGTYGYEVEHALPVLVRKFATDQAVRAKVRVVLVPRPDSLTGEERAWLAHQRFVRSIGSIHIYEIINP